MKISNNAPTLQQNQSITKKAIAKHLADNFVKILGDYYFHDMDESIKLHAQHLTQSMGVKLEASIIKLLVGKS